MHLTLAMRGGNILGGIPISTGTRMPVKTLGDYLKANYPLDEFLDDFPIVTQQQAQQVIEAAGWQVAE